jgi:hypothetical protein
VKNPGESEKVACVSKGFSLKEQVEKGAGTASAGFLP